MPPTRLPFFQSKNLTFILGAIAVFAALVLGFVVRQIQSPKEGEERSIGGATMVFVPAGEFLMGGTDAQVQAAYVLLLQGCPNCPPDSFDDLKPLHPIYLDAFWMDKFEVTNAQYRECVKSGICTAPSNVTSNSRQDYYDDSHYDSYPVIYVSWQDAKTFCDRANKRLPTEAEWEKAARGTDKRTYPWGESWSAVEINAEERIRDTAGVGDYPDDASPYGVMDMAGNVREWIADWYDAKYYASSPYRNPSGALSGQFRVVRGGSWGAHNFASLTAFREAWDPATTENYIGFRCVKGA